MTDIIQFWVIKEFRVSKCLSSVKLLTSANSNIFNREVTIVTVRDDLTSWVLVVQVENCWFNDDTVVNEHAENEQKEADEVRPSKLLPFYPKGKAPDDNRADRIEDFSGNERI